MKRTLNIILLILYSLSVVAQSSEGGGAYIVNNGKLTNCILTKNYAGNGFGASGIAGQVLNCTIQGNLYLNKALVYVGDVLLNDGSIYTPQKNSDGSIVSIPANVQTNAVGVCFWTNGNNDYLNAKAWIIAINESSATWAPTVNNQQVDIANLFNFSDPSGAITDKDGAGNTTKIISDPQFTSTPLTTTNCAATYCNQYGTVGEWFLPSLSQSRELSRSITTINKILAALNKTQISTTEKYWTSTEVAPWGAWLYDFSTSGVTYSNQKSKDTLLKVRAMRIFKQSN